MTTRQMFVVAIAWVTAIAGAAALVLNAGAAPSLTGSSMSPVLTGIALAIVTDASVGAVLTLKRPGNVVGLVLLAAAILMAVMAVGFVSGAVLTEQRGRHDFVAGLASLIGPLGIYPAIIVAGPLVALFFPDGRLPGPRWRWPLGAIAAAVAVSSATVALRPGPPGASFADNPFGLGGFSGTEPLWGVGETIGAVALPFALVLALAAVIVRVRRSADVERAQIKWFVAANVAVIVLLTLSFFDGPIGPTIFDVLSPWSLSLPPIAIGVAILRYRLFEIDRIISRTLSWTVVTGLLGAVFVGLVVGLQALSADITGTNTLAVAASTLVVAALFQPLRRRIQSAVDRRFNRARYDAQRTTDAFAGQLRNEVDLGKLRAALVDTVEEAVRPASATVWLRAGSGR
jgi:hypothetical protein